MEMRSKIMSDELSLMEKVESAKGYVVSSDRERLELEDVLAVNEQLQLIGDIFEEHGDTKAVDLHQALNRVILADYDLLRFKECLKADDMFGSITSFFNAEEDRKFELAQHHLREQTTQLGYIQMKAFSIKNNKEV